MTSKFNENDEHCFRCAYFKEDELITSRMIPYLGKRSVPFREYGYCDNEAAEHYQHVLRRFHTACGLCERE